MLKRFMRICVIAQFQRSFSAVVRKALESLSPGLQPDALPSKLSNRMVFFLGVPQSGAGV